MQRSPQASSGSILPSFTSGLRFSPSMRGNEGP